MTMTVEDRTRMGCGTDDRRRERGRMWAGWMLVAYLVPLAVLVLSIRLTDSGLPQLADEVVHWATDLALVPSLRFGHVEALANIAVFVPIGFLLTRLLGQHLAADPSGSELRGTGLPAWGVWLAATALSGAIESTQMFLLTERSATLRDLVCNSVGALAGVLIHRVFRVFRHKARRRVGA